MRERGIREGKKRHRIESRQGKQSEEEKGEKEGPRRVNRDMKHRGIV